MFVKDWEEEFCKMEVCLPEDNPINQTDFEHLRTSVRKNGESGFLFVNNYQRRYEMKKHLDVTLKVALEKETICYPKRTINNGDYFFYPFNMKIETGILEYINATPLCKINHEGTKTYFFYSDLPVEYKWKVKPKNVKIVVLSRAEALNAYKITLEENEFLIINSNVCMENDNKGV